MLAEGDERGYDLYLDEYDNEDNKEGNSNLAVEVFAKWNKYYSMLVKRYEQAGDLYEKLASFNAYFVKVGDLLV